MKKLLAFLMVIMIALAGCATMGGQNPVPVVNWSPEKKATYAMGMYTKLFNNYLSRVAMATGVSVEDVKLLMMTEEGQAQLKSMIAVSTLTEYQRQILRKRKEFLVLAEKVIKSYNTYISLGNAPPEGTEAQLLDLLDKLEMMTVQ
jgi:hypothetical protein